MAEQQNHLQARRQRPLSEVAATFDEKYQAVTESGCWLWMAAVSSSGYGAIKLGRGMQLAHRVSWMIHRGSIPPGSLVCHRCDTRSCVNSDHLFLGSPQDNMDDMRNKGRQDYPAGQRHSHAALSDRDVYAIRASGLTSVEVSRRFGIAECTANQILHRKAWNHLSPRLDEVSPPPRRHAQGSALPQTKLTEESVLAIRADQRSSSVVGKSYGVSGSLVLQIRKRLVWRHLPDPEEA